VVVAQDEQLYEVALVVALVIYVEQDPQVDLN
jgi:hypothetical protein